MLINPEIISRVAVFEWRGNDYKSIVGDDKRDYQKPWLKNAGGKKKNEDEKKSFLKHHYPDESGPDAELIKMLEREVVDFTPNITFDDIAELQKAKDVLE